MGAAKRSRYVSFWLGNCSPPIFKSANDMPFRFADVPRNSRRADTTLTFACRQYIYIYIYEKQWTRQTDRFAFFVQQSELNSGSILRTFFCGLIFHILVTRRRRVTLKIRIGIEICMAVI